MVVEGVNAILAAMELAKKYEAEMPILTAVNAIINHEADTKNAVRELMGETARQN